MYQTAGNIDIYKLAQRILKLQQLDSQRKNLEHFLKGHDHNYRHALQKVVTKKTPCGKKHTKIKFTKYFFQLHGVE